MLSPDGDSCVKVASSETLAYVLILTIMLVDTTINLLWIFSHSTCSKMFSSHVLQAYFFFFWLGGGVTKDDIH